MPIVKFQWTQIVDDQQNVVRQLTGYNIKNNMFYQMSEQYGVAASNRMRSLVETGVEIDGEIII